MPHQCIQCGREENLNTQLTITIDNDEKVTVYVCDEHAEDMTVKIAREKYLAKQKQIADFLAQAKALGIEIAPASNGGTFVIAQQSQPTVQQQPIRQQRSQPIHRNQEEIPNTNGEGWVPTTKADNMISNVNIIDESNGMVGPLNNQPIVNGSDILPHTARNGRVKMQMVEGRGGVPVPIQSTRVDGTGITNISVVKSQNDDALQRRFRNMAQRDISSRDNCMMTCRACRGDCFINDVVCSVCDGLGMVSGI